MKTISRRKFVGDALKVSAITAVGTPLIFTSRELVAHEAIKKMPALQFSQIVLPYAYSALEPSIDAQTMVEIFRKIKH